jgi:nitroreductase
VDADELLTTTRAVRRRLDLTRAVDPALIDECLAIALQAPSGGNDQSWHFVVVTDPSQRAAVAAVYQAASLEYASRPREPMPDRRARSDSDRAARLRVMESAAYLFEHIAEVPVIVVPCIHGRVESLALVDQATAWGSILPAVWSFMLAARARGLGTSWTTVHTAAEADAAQILGIPYDEVTQVALIPVAHTVGDRFGRATRRSVDEVAHFERW